MRFSEIKMHVIEEYDTRNLVSDVRYKALDDFDQFLKTKDMLKFWNNVSLFPTEKLMMKKLYERHKGKRLNSAESSMINEIYNQLAVHEIALMDYHTK